MSEETQQEKALFRFQVIGPLLALDLPRGKKRAALRELAGKTWTLQNGENLKVSEESIRRWLRLYREGGFEAIKDRPHPPQGGRLPEDVIAARHYGKNKRNFRSSWRILRSGYPSSGKVTVLSISTTPSPRSSDIHEKISRQSENGLPRHTLIKGIGTTSLQPGSRI